MASTKKIQQAPSVLPLEKPSEIHKNLDFLNVSEKIKSEFITEFPKSPIKMLEESNVTNDGTTFDFLTPPNYQRSDSQQTTINIELDDTQLSLANALPKN